MKKLSKAALFNACNRQGANPYKPSWNPRMSAKSRARRSPHHQLHQIAPRWN